MKTKIAIIGNLIEFKRFINDQPDIVRNNVTANVVESESNIYHLVDRAFKIEGQDFDSFIYLYGWGGLRHIVEIRENIKFCLLRNQTV